MSDNVEMKDSHLGKRRSRSPSMDIVPRCPKRVESNPWGFYDWRVRVPAEIADATGLPLVLAELILDYSIDYFNPKQEMGESGILVCTKREGVWLSIYGGFAILRHHVNGMAHGDASEVNSVGEVFSRYGYIAGAKLMPLEYEKYRKFLSDRGLSFV